MTAVVFDSQPGGTQTLATFKGWAKGLHDALLAVGLVQVPSGQASGQINFDLVTTLPTATSSVGYAIYAFSDSQQTIAPLFLRVEYRVGVASRATIYMDLIKSFTSAGAVIGSLGGNSNLTYSDTAETLRTSHIAHGDGWLTISLFAGTTTTNAGQQFAFERSRINGAPTPTAVLTARSFSFAVWDYATLNQRSQSGALRFPEFGSLGTFDLGVTPVFPSAPMFPIGAPPWQPISMLAVPPNDRPPSPFPCILEGVSRQYQNPDMYSGRGMAASSSASAASTNATALLWQ